MLTDRRPRRHTARRVVVVAAALLLFCACAFRRSTEARAAAPDSAIVVLVSLDGFRWDYVDRHSTPNLKRLAASGVRARWLVPAFPTQTFPNHYTLVTGLVPSRHGIVANTFVDPSGAVRFRFTDSAVVSQSHWWGGEPLWVTAVRQGRRTATFFWPGSEAEITGVRPTYWKRYDGRIPNASRVDTVLAWLALPEAQRPVFVTLYFNDVDAAGHEYGPDSPELASAVARLDSMVGRLMVGIARQSLEDRVNLIVVSDHGMAPTSPDSVLVLDDYLVPASVDAVSLGSFVSLIPVDHDTARVLHSLASVPHLRVYSATATPARWRYQGNLRIAPIVGVAEEGWLLTTRASLSSGRVTGGGDHGSDNADTLMRATFIAAGPAFRGGVLVEPFASVHVYELICALLGLRPAPNDGSLDSVRALLKTESHARSEWP